MRNWNLTCGLTTGRLIANKDGAQKDDFFMCSTYAKPWRPTDIWGFAELTPDRRATLSATSRQLLAENGDQSLMACYIALDSHRAKGQVCLKFALQCISGDDLDFLSLAPPRAQRWKGRERERAIEAASFQPFPIF